MQFVYKPSGTSEKKWKRWEFAPAKMINKDAEAIEDLTDWTFIEWQTKFFNGSVKAVHALLFIYLRRDNPQLRYDDVVFTDEEFELEPDAKEEAALEALADASDAGDDQSEATPKAS